MIKKIIVPITIFILSLSFMISFSILGNISRDCYISDISILEESNTISGEKIFRYSVNIQTKDPIFKQSDLYYIFLNNKKLPDYIKEVIVIKNGDKKIEILSSEELSYDKEYKAEYILNLKEEVYIIGIIICLFMISVITIILVKNIKYRALLLYLYFFIFTLIGNVFLKLSFNYIGIFLAISCYFIFNIKQPFIKEFIINDKYKFLIVITTSILIGTVNIFIINLYYPFVGEDISMILPRAYSLLTYAENNGIFNIEFASPLFGAGLISYPNPQYDQFSIFYFLRYIMPFWKAYLLCTFIFSIIGFISYYCFSKEVLKLNFEISLMSSILFSFTGYYIYHIMIGHWTFLYHPLTALIVYLSFCDRFNYIIRILINALLFSIMLFGGAMQTVFFYTCFTLLAVASILFKPNKKFIYQCISIMASFLLSIVLSMSKFVMSLYFGKLIERGEQGIHTNNPIHIIRNIINTFLTPIQNIISYTRDFNGLIWERDIALPVFMIILIAIMIFYNLKNSSLEEKKEFIKKYKFNILFLLMFIYLYCDLFFANGIIRSSFTKLRYVNLHYRVSSSLIIPLVMIFSILFNKFKFNNKNNMILFIMLSTSILYSYKFINIYSINNNFKEINIDFDNDVFMAIKNNHSKYKVTYINNKLEINNMRDFTNNNYELNTSRLPYESIYGYGLETFKAKEEGSPYKIIDGRYNFTDPRSLIFFNDNFPQFSGFSTNDTKKLDNFLSFKEVKWEVPKYFIISNYISAFLHIIVIIILVLYLVYKIFIKK
ncbi:hypothetical protein [Brachyspira innocens]|uniref:hypothetical protein n=1 Tax=Brachyspira innocens TaxID=13264 RepID=UPI0026E9C03A|nr:hypothetical protein [Brachyspira innocens]